MSETQAPPPAQPASPPAAAVSNTGPKTWVLLVEDEDELANIMVQNLSNAGFSTVWSRTFPEALNKLRNQAFSCILLDLKIEKGKGEDIIPVIRNDKKGFNFKTPVILISGHLDQTVLTSFKTLIQGAFVKPVNYEALIAKMKALVAQLQAGEL